MSYVMEYGMCCRTFKCYVTVFTLFILQVLLKLISKLLQFLASVKLTSCRVTDRL
jgi:hypothetical protein